MAAAAAAAQLWGSNHVALTAVVCLLPLQTVMLQGPSVTASLAGADSIKWQANHVCASTAEKLFVAPAVTNIGLGSKQTCNCRC